MKQRLTSLALTVVMLLTMLPVEVLAAEVQSDEPLLEEEILCTVEEDALPDSEKLLAEYVDRAFFGTLDMGYFGTLAYDRLNGVEKYLYDQLKVMIKAVAAGERNSSEFADIDVSGFDITCSIYEDGTGEIFGVDTRNLMNAMLSDMPYELYWFDKTKTGGWRYSWSYNPSTGKVHSLSFSFSVSADYAVDGVSGKYVIDTDKTGAASAAASNFQDVVDEACDRCDNDYEVLEYFHDTVIDLTDYNHDAADNDPPYGDPWQLIHVFDGNPNTMVVCEGYAKAFKYLCDAVDIDCYLVSGDLVDTGGSGGHMWNVVRMEVNDEEQSWLVDCTGDDQSTISHDLFMKAPASGNVRSGYRFDFFTSWVEYVYDYNEMVSLYGKDAIELTDLDYEEAITTVRPKEYVLTENEDLREVLASVAKGAVIDLNQYTGVVNDDKSDSAPWVIDKKVTIKNGTLDVRAGGIVLGADVVLEDVVLSFDNPVRNAIIANGYTLVLDNVTRDESARQVHLFCGSLSGYNGSVEIPEPGDCGDIFLLGDTSLGNVYAGSLSHDGEYNRWGFANAMENIVSAVTVEKAASVRMDALYGCGAIETPVSNNWFEFGEPEAPVPNYSEFELFGRVYVETYDRAFTKIDGANGPDGMGDPYSDTYVFFNGSGNMATIEVENLRLLCLESGYLAPSTYENIFVLNIGDAELDLYSARENKDGARYKAYRLLGSDDKDDAGILTIGWEDEFFVWCEEGESIDGYVELQTANYRPVNKSTSGLVNDGRVYVQCVGKKPADGKNIIFTPNESQNGTTLSYSKTTGSWTAVVSNDILPMESFEIYPNEEIVTTPSQFLGRINLNIRYAPEYASYPYDFAHKIKVQKDGGTVYTNTWDAEEYTLCKFPALNLAVDIYDTYLDITRCDWSKLVEPGEYTVTVETPSGNKTFTNVIQFTVEDDTAITIGGDSAKSGDTLWYYSDVTLTAPEGYTIGSDMSEPPTANTLTIAEDRLGKFTYYLYAEREVNDNGDIGSGYLTRTIELNRDATAPVIKTVDTWAYDANGKITVSADDGKGSGVADYALSLTDADGIEVTRKNGEFTLKGLTAGEEYHYTVSVTDKVGNVSREEGVLVPQDLPAPKLTLTVSGGTLPDGGFVYGNTVKVAVKLSKNTPMTILSGSSAKGRVEIRDAETDAVLYTKKDVVVSNSMKDLTLSASRGILAVGSYGYYAVFIPNDAYKSAVGETQTNVTEISIAKKTLTVSGLKDLTVKDDGTGLITIGGKPALSGLVKGDKVSFADAPKTYQLQAGDRVDESDPNYYVGKFHITVPYTVTGEDALNYYFVQPQLNVTVLRNAIPYKVVITGLEAADANTTVSGGDGTYSMVSPKYTAEDYVKGNTPYAKGFISAKVYDQYGAEIANAEKSLTYSAASNNVWVYLQKDKSQMLVVAPKANEIVLNASCKLGKVTYKNLIVEHAITLQKDAEVPVYCTPMYSTDGKTWLDAGSSLYLRSAEEGTAYFGMSVKGSYGNDLYEQVKDSFVWTVEGLDENSGVTQGEELRKNEIRFEKEATDTLIMTGAVGETGVNTSVEVYVAPLPKPVVSMTMSSSNKAAPNTFTYGDSVKFAVTVAKGDPMTILSGKSATGKVQIRDAETGAAIYTKAVTVSNTMKNVVVSYSKTGFDVDEHSFYAVFVPDPKYTGVVALSQTETDGFEVGKKTLTVGGLKNLTVKDNGTGLITIGGKPALSGLVKGDKVSFADAPKTYQLQAGDRVDESDSNYYVGKFRITIPYTVTGADAENYNFVQPQLTVTVSRNPIPYKVVITGLEAADANTTVSGGDGTYSMVSPKYTAEDFVKGNTPYAKGFVSAKVYDQYGAEIANAEKSLTYNSASNNVWVYLQKDKSQMLVVAPKANEIALTASCKVGKVTYKNLIVEHAITLQKDAEVPVYCTPMYSTDGENWLDAGSSLYLRSAEAGTAYFGMSVKGSYGNDLYEQVKDSFVWTVEGLDENSGVTQGEELCKNEIRFEKEATDTLIMTGAVGETGVNTSVEVYVAPLPKPVVSMTMSSSNKAAPDTFTYGDSVTFAVTVAKGNPMTILSGKSATGKVQIRDAETGAAIYTKAVTVSNTMKNVVVSCSKTGFDVDEHSFYAVFVPDAKYTGVVALSQTETDGFEVGKKTLTVGGLKNLTVKDNGTGLITIGGKPALSGLVKGDKVNFADAPKTYQLEQDEDGFYLGTHTIPIPYTVAGEDAENYNFVQPQLTVTVTRNPIPYKVVITDLIKLTESEADLTKNGSAFAITAPKYTKTHFEDGVAPYGKFTIIAAVQDQYGGVITGAEKNLSYSSESEGVWVYLQKDKSQKLVMLPNANEIALTASCKVGKVTYKNLSVEHAITLNKETEVPVYGYAMYSVNGSTWSKIEDHVYISSQESGEVNFGLSIFGCYGNNMYDQLGGTFRWQEVVLDADSGVTQSGSSTGNRIEIEQNAGKEEEVVFEMTGSATGLDPVCKVTVHVAPIPLATVTLAAAKTSYVYGSDVALTATLSPAGVPKGQKVSGTLNILNESGEVLVSKAVTLSTKAVKLSYTLKCSAVENRLDAGIHENAFYAEFIPNAAGTKYLAIGGGYLESLTITPKQLTVSGLKAVTMKIGADFDGLIPLSGTPVLSGLAAGDAVGIDAPETIQLSLPVGKTWLSYYKKAKSVSVSGLALTGIDAGNYTLKSPAIKVALK